MSTTMVPTCKEKSNQIVLHTVF